MEAKHTPGPWRAEPSRTDHGDYYHRIVADDYGLAVACTVNVPNGDREGMEADAADARLLAGAPTMLAALKTALLQLKNDNNAESCPAVIAVRYAISLAEGGAR